MKNELKDIIQRKMLDKNLFDLTNGRVFHSQILRCEKFTNKTNLLTESDILLCAFHHAVFDRTSTQIFYNDLSIAYNNDLTILVDDNVLQYIDYATHERLIDMTLPQEFGNHNLKDIISNTMYPYQLIDIGHQMINDLVIHPLRKLFLTMTFQQHFLITLLIIKLHHFN